MTVENSRSSLPKLQSTKLGNLKQVHNNAQPTKKINLVDEGNGVKIIFLLEDKGERKNFIFTAMVEYMTVKGIYQPHWWVYGDLYLEKQIIIDM